MKLADAITWSRIVLILPITVLVLLHLRIAAGILVIVAFFTDFLDGYVARKTKTASKKGAELDSRVDSVCAIAFFAWIIFLFYASFLQYWYLFAIMISLIILEMLVARWKIGTWTGLHLYSEKAGAIVGGIALALLFFLGFQLWLILPAVIVGSLGQIEAVIYLLKGGKNLDAKSMFSD